MLGPPSSSSSSSSSLLSSASHGGAFLSHSPSSSPSLSSSSGSSLLRRLQPPASSSSSASSTSSPSPSAPSLLSSLSSLLPFRAVSRMCGSLPRCAPSLVSAVVVCVLLNLCVSVWFIAHIDREKHLSTEWLSSAFLSDVSPASAVCPLTFPVRPCGPAQSMAAPQLAALQAEMRSTLSALDGIRVALLLPAPPLPPPSAPATLPFLLIGIPTVARSSPAASRYLSTALQSIKAQLPIDPLHPLYSQVHVLVMNHSPLSTPHTAFEEAKTELEGDSANPAYPFHFVHNPGVLRDATPELKDSGSPNVPGYKVRKQTRDIVATATAAMNRSRFYVFMEDDFEWCPHTLQLLTYMVDKAHRLHPHPFSFKFSFGMNGFMVANGPDLQHFLDYLLNHQRLRPPDHILTEWSAGEKESAAYKGQRPHIVYRYNLLHHLGSVSSLREQMNAEYPPCWHEMNGEVVFEVESFRGRECDHDDVWPCRSAEEVRQLKPHSPLWMEPFNIPDQRITEAQKK